MSDLRAFELRPEYKLDELAGATTVFGPETQTLDIKAALTHAEGTIVTDNNAVAAALLGSPLLVETGVPEEPAVTPLSVDLSTVEEQRVSPPLFIPQSPLPGQDPAQMVRDMDTALGIESSSEAQATEPDTEPDPEQPAGPLIPPAPPAENAEAGSQEPDPEPSSTSRRPRR